MVVVHSRLLLSVFCERTQLICPTPGEHLGSSQVCTFQTRLPRALPGLSQQHLSCDLSGVCGKWGGQAMELAYI